MPPLSRISASLRLRIWALPLRGRWAPESRAKARDDIVELHASARADIVEAHAKRTRSVRFACVSTMSECASTMLRVRSAPGRPKIWPRGLARPIRNSILQSVVLRPRTAKSGPGLFWSSQGLGFDNVGARAGVRPGGASKLVPATLPRHVFYVRGFGGGWGFRLLEV